MTMHIRTTLLRHTDDKEIKMATHS